MKIIKYNSSDNDKRGSTGGYNVKVNQSTYDEISNSSTTPQTQEQLWQRGGITGSLIPAESNNVTEGIDSVAIGTYTETTNQGEFATGYFNNSTPDLTLFSVGYGTDDSHRRNVFEVNTDGTTYNSGNSYIGGDGHISGNTYIGGDGHISGNTYIGGDGHIDGNTYIGGNTYIDENVYGDGSATFDGKIESNTEVETPLISAQNGNISNLVSNDIETDYLDVDIRAVIEELLATDITTENLTVTKAAHFFKLIIDEIKASKGQIIVTPSNAKIDLVESITGGYRCYFRANDADGKEIINTFEQGDQIICQTFNAATGTSYNVSNKFYWRLCNSVSSNVVNKTINGQSVPCWYIDLDDTDKDSSSNAAPAAGDEIVTLGNRRNTSRQSAIIISAYNNTYLDPAILSPSIVQYFGINNFNLSNHRTNVISRGFNSFRGSFTTSSGDDIEELIEEAAEASNAYVHMAWANSADGSVDFTKTNTGGDYSYMGFCSNNTESDASLTYTDYEWNSIQGSHGADAEYYTLNPVMETAIVDKNGTLGVEFRYNIIHVIGNTRQLETASANGYFVRMRPDTSSIYTNLSYGNEPSYANANYFTNYHKRQARPNLFYIELVKSNNNTLYVLEQKLILVQFDAAASLQITDQITATVQGQQEDIDDLSGTVTSHTNSISTLTQNYNSISGTVSSHTTYINSLSGDVESIYDDVSELQITADQISSEVSRQGGYIDNITGEVEDLSHDVSNITQTAEQIQSTVTHLRANATNLFNFTECNFSHGDYQSVLPAVQSYGIECKHPLSRVYNLGFNGEGGDFTVSFECKLFGLSSAQVAVQLCDKTPVEATYIQVNDTDWRKFTFTFKNVTQYIGDSSDTKPYNGFIDFENSNFAYSKFMVVRHLMVTRGTCASEFQVSPKDMGNGTNEKFLEWTYAASIEKTNEKYNGMDVYQPTTIPSSGYYDYIRCNDVEVKQYKIYTLSFWAKGNQNGVCIDSHFYNNPGQISHQTNWVYKWYENLPYGVSEEGNYSNGRTVSKLTNEWKQYIIYFNNWEPNNRNVIACRFDSAKNSGLTSPNFKICGVQIREGYWTKEQMNSESQITQRADYIEARVNDVSVKIDSGQITLNGDTNVNGTLTLSEAGQGFILAGTYDNFINNASPNVLVNNVISRQVEPWSLSQSTTTASWSFSNSFGTVSSGVTIPLSGQSISFRNYNSGNVLTPYSITNTYKVYINGSLISGGTFTNSATSGSVGSFTTTSSGTLRVDVTSSVTFTTSSLVNNEVIGIYNYYIKLPKTMFTMIGYDGIASNFGNNSNVYFGPQAAYLRYGNHGLKITSDGIMKLNPNGNGNYTTLDTVKVKNITNSDVSSNIYNVAALDEFLVVNRSGTTYIQLPDASYHIGRKLYIKNKYSGASIYIKGTIRTHNDVDTASEVYIGNNSTMVLSDGTAWVRFHCGD